MNMKKKIQRIKDEIIKIETNFIDLSNECQVSKITAIVEILISLSRIDELIDSMESTHKISSIIEEINTINFHHLLNFNDSGTQLDSIICLVYKFGMIKTLFDYDFN